MSKTIEDILKDMPLDDEVKSGLKEAWNKSLADAKVAQEAKVREELSARYEGDMEKVHEAFGLFLEERIKPHVEELQEGVASVEAMKRRYAERTTKIKEAAQAHVKARLGAVEKVMEKIIRRELGELHEDVVANRKATLQAITEKRAAMEQDRQKFRAKAARVLENIVNVKLPKQLDELREDIAAARQDNFGREIFEAFQATFRNQFFASSKEFRKLSEQLENLRKQNSTVKAKAAKVVKESREAAAASEKARKKLEENVTRGKTMARLLQPLTGNSRAQMKALLEATKTENLEKTYKKALPQIVREHKPVKSSGKKLHESKSGSKVEFLDGGTEALTEDAYDPFDDEVLDIRRRAGTAK